MKSVFFISVISLFSFIILLAGCGSNNENPVSTGDQGESIPQVKGESGPKIDDYKDKDIDKFISALKNVGMFDTAYALSEEIKAAQQQIVNQGWGVAYVIVGRIIIDGSDDPRNIYAQMEVLADGYFAGPVKDLVRPVGFRLHGYVPFDLELNGMKGKSGSVVNVGTIHLTPLPAGESANLKGKIVLEGDGNFDPAKTKITLCIQVGPINSLGNGLFPRERWPEPFKVTIQPSGDFFVDKCCPTDYYMIVSSPGHVDQTSVLTFKPGETLDLGIINMEIPKKIDLTYYTSVVKKFNAAGEKHTVIDAGTKWDSFGDELGAWDIELTQKEGKIVFNYGYGPCSIADLGAGDIKDFLNEDSLNKVSSITPYNIEAQNGHVYLLDQQFFQHFVLFKCEF